MKYRGVGKVEEIADMLEHGANLGIEGEGRGPSQERSNKSVYIFGERARVSVRNKYDWPSSRTDGRVMAWGHRCLGGRSVPNDALISVCGECG